MPGSATYILSSVAATPAIMVSDSMLRATVLPPALLCNVSVGASLTYTVEVTGDNTAAPNWSSAGANWMTLDPTLAALTADATVTLTAAVTAVRARITVYTSGSLTFQLVWGNAISFGLGAA